MKKGIIFIAIALIFSKTSPGWGEEDGSKQDLGKIIVTATKTNAYQNEVGSSFTVITEEDIKKTGKVDISDVLKDTPGISISQAAPFGGRTLVYLRGAKPGQTLVMLDGVELNDPMETDRSFNFANLTTVNVERIEVIRGAQSTLYGSDAMAGVINIITKKGKGKPKLEANVQGGSCNTFIESASLGGSEKAVNYSLAFSQINSRGISQARAGVEPDGYASTTLSSRMGWQLYDKAEINLYARYVNSETDMDDGAYNDDPNYTTWNRLFASKAEFVQNLMSWWDHKFSFSFSDNSRKYRDDRDYAHPRENLQSSWFKGDIMKLEWQHNFSFLDWDTITTGFELETERGSSYNANGSSVTKIDRQTLDTKSWYMEKQLKFFDMIFITPGMRVDYNSIYKTETTYRVSGVFSLKDLGARLKGSVGTGFKAPSLYQLYSIYGNHDLKPDRSVSYDFGIEKDFLPGVFSSSVTYFHNDFKDMIDWDSVAYRYKNISRAKTWGYETAFTFRPIDKLAFSVYYTYTATKDMDSGKRLPRRPENDIGISVDWEIVKETKLNIKTRYVDRTWDDALNIRKVKPYSVTDLFFTYDLTRNIQLFLRSNNIFDYDYQEVYGYSTPGRTLYVGGKAVF